MATSPLHYFDRPTCGAGTSVLYCVEIEQITRHMCERMTIIRLMKGASPKQLRSQFTLLNVIKASGSKASGSPSLNPIRG